MLTLHNLVESMAEQRFVEPIEKSLLTEYGLRVDTKAVVPVQEAADDSICKKGECSWWNKVLDVSAKDVTVFECADVLESSLCAELCLLKCSQRCCMNWTTYNTTNCMDNKNTSCIRLHQLSLYTHTLSELGKSVARLTEWPVHFITCESVNSEVKEPMHLNKLRSLVDTFNILILNPNPFPITIILQEKPRPRLPSSQKTPKKRGRKMVNRVVGTCQMSISVNSGRIICITNNTINHWNIYSVSFSIPNYMVCVLGRYDLSNWLIKKMLQGKNTDKFSHEGINVGGTCKSDQDTGTKDPVAL